MFSPMLSRLPDANPDRCGVDVHYMCFFNLPAECECAAGDAIMGMIVTHLVFSFTSNGDCETLHDRRKVLVRPVAPLTRRLAVAAGLRCGLSLQLKSP